MLGGQEIRWSWFGTKVVRHTGDPVVAFHAVIVSP